MIWFPAIISIWKSTTPNSRRSPTEVRGFLHISREPDKLSRSCLDLLLEENYPHRMVWVSGMCGHALYRNFKKGHYFFRGFCTRVAKRCYLEPHGPLTKFG